MLYVQKKWRRLFGKCPYCKAKLIEGVGGTSLLYLSGLKMCPNKHYAEELHVTGATFIYDNGGRPLKISGLDGKEAFQFNAMENKLIEQGIIRKKIHSASITNTSVELRFDDGTYLDLTLDEDACEIITSHEASKD